MTPSTTATTPSTTATTEHSQQRQQTQQRPGQQRRRFVRAANYRTASRVLRKRTVQGVRSESIVGYSTVLPNLLF
jgi:hypothetical protein